MKSFNDESQLPHGLIKARNDRFEVEQDDVKKAREHIKPEVDDTHDKKFWEGEGLALEFKKVDMNEKKI